MEEWRNGRLEGWECGRPSMPIKTLKAIIDLEGCGPSQPRNPTELSTLDAYLLATRQSPPFVQYGAEGPDALQVLIKAAMVLPDLGGLQSLAAAEPT